MAATLKTTVIQEPSSSTANITLAADGSSTIVSPTITNTTVTNYLETVNALGSGTAFSPSLSNGTLITLTTNGSTTVTLPSSVAGKSFLIVVKYGGAHSLAWAGGTTLKWANGVTPTPTSVLNKFDIFAFFQDGTNTYGTIVGQNF